MTDLCVCCGEYCGEGRMICPQCEKMVDSWAERWLDRLREKQKEKEEAA